MKQGFFFAPGKITAIFFLYFLTACAGDRFGAKQVSYEHLAGWQADSHLQALETFVKTCPVFAQKPRKTTDGSDLEIGAAIWQSLCSEAAWSKSSPQQAKFFFESRFTPFRINNNGKEQGLFTGYYEPVLYGSYKRKHDFQYPVYAVPPELKNNKPYFTHAEINAGALKGRHLELLWVDDPVMLFFTQIQGSGRVRMTDGKELYLGYGDGNGQPYVSLGKIMGDENILPKDQINFFTIREWLYSHPDKAFALMERNPSYIFFTLRDAPAVGAAGISLTPQRSIAVDPKYIPYGLPLFMETTLPDAAQTVFHRLVIAQDTGGAIRGPVRADIFFGTGDAAEYLAGYMKGRGVYSLLVPNEIMDQLK